MPTWAEMPLAERIQIAQACLDGVVREAREWVMAACRAKNIAFDSPLAAEEIANGPLATVRYLRLLLGTLESCAAIKPFVCRGARAGTGRPSAYLFCRAKAHRCRPVPRFQRTSAAAHLQENLSIMLLNYRRPRPAGVSLVLGRRQRFETPTDVFYKLFHEGRVVLLKMNPVNEYLGDVFARCDR
jgi:aldehyde dehydrogenase (NAD(P)+)